MTTDQIYNGSGGATKLLKMTMPRILVLGKNERDLSSIAASVAGLSHFVTSAWDVDSLSNAVANGSPEIVILDMRSGENALPYAKDLVANYDQVAEAPRMAVIENIDAKELQSRYLDDFILYPYEASELALRIARLLAKGQSAKEGKQITADGLVIDTESFEVTVEGRQLALTFKEFELLRFLAAHPGRVHTREALLNQVWGYEYFGGLRTVDVHVRRIRAKLGIKHDNLIQTVHGVGYKFVT
ncbi:MAG: winged helix-turn-helix domain-containing protein [Armatimonadota bacterium]